MHTSGLVVELLVDESARFVEDVWGAGALVETLRVVDAAVQFHQDALEAGATHRLRHLPHRRAALHGRNRLVVEILVLLRVLLVALLQDVQLFITQR